MKAILFILVASSGYVRGQLNIKTFKGQTFLQDHKIEEGQGLAKAGIAGNSNLINLFGGSLQPTTSINNQIQGFSQDNLFQGSLNTFPVQSQYNGFNFNAEQNSVPSLRLDQFETGFANIPQLPPVVFGQGPVIPPVETLPLSFYAPTHLPKVVQDNPDLSISSSSELGGNTPLVIPQIQEIRFNTSEKIAHIQAPSDGNSAPTHLPKVVQDNPDLSISSSSELGGNTPLVIPQIQEIRFNTSEKIAHIQAPSDGNSAPTHLPKVVQDNPDLSISSSSEFGGNTPLVIPQIQEIRFNTSEKIAHIQAPSDGNSAPTHLPKVVQDNPDLSISSSSEFGGNTPLVIPQIQEIRFNTSEKIAHIQAPSDGNSAPTHLPKVVQDNPDLSISSSSELGGNTPLVIPQIQEIRFDTSEKIAHIQAPSDGNSAPTHLPKVVQDNPDLSISSSSEFGGNTPLVIPQIQEIRFNTSEKIAHIQAPSDGNSASIETIGINIPSEELITESPAVIGPAINEIPAITAPVNNEIPAVTTDNKIDEEWEQYKIRYEKSYASLEEDSRRRLIYYDNKGTINNFNVDKETLGFELGINKYADITLNEFNDQLNGLRLSAKRDNGSTYIPSGFVSKPQLMDWRNYTGAVTSVKDQGECFSCWAFTAAAVLESHWWRKTGETVDISEQNIIDCRTDGEEDSCAPGYYTTGWEYIRDNKGVDGEEIYPYESQDNDNFTCRFKREGVVATVTGFVELPPHNEERMELAVATIGPIAAAIDANVYAQQFYKSGVLKSSDKSQCTENVNHAVTIVGYGEENGKKYWLIKNSYGSDWGIDGYLKLARGENACGISLNPAYPLV